MDWGGVKPVEREEEARLGCLDVLSAVQGILKGLRGVMSPSVTQVRGVSKLASLQQARQCMAGRPAGAIVSGCW